MELTKHLNSSLATPGKYAADESRSQDEEGNECNIRLIKVLMLLADIENPYFHLFDHEIGKRFSCV